MDKLKDLLVLKNAFEADGQHALGVHLTPDWAKELRWELHQYYGKDPGERLTTVYGMEVLSLDAEEVRFEG
ncbi:MAG: hypothetical protein HQM03_17090 [Magnetococcales bacterium]|nr:hypothetical protein [Magnetococcales bacterium]